MMKTLFCYDMPQGGKSILTSLVIDDLTHRFQKNNDIAISFVYCRFQNQTEEKLESLASAILAQLVRQQQSVSISIVDAYSAHPRIRPGVEKLQDMLRVASRSFSCAHVVIDALDEYGPSDADRSRLISLLHDLQNTGNLKKFDTVRDVPDVSGLFKSSHPAEIRATDADLRAYLHRRLSDSPKFIKSNVALSDEIVTAVVNITDGI